MNIAACIEGKTMFNRLRRGGAGALTVVLLQAMIWLNVVVLLLLLSTLVWSWALPGDPRGELAELKFDAFIAVLWPLTSVTVSFYLAALLLFRPR